MNMGPLILLIRARLQLAVYVASAIVGGSVMLVLGPRSYEATTTILPAPLSAEGNKLGLAAPILHEIQSLASNGADTLNGTGLGNIYLSILKSRSVIDATIEHFSLQEVYGTTSLDRAREELASNVAIISTPEQAIVINVRDHDPKRARDIANFMVNTLTSLTKSFTLTTAQHNRVFLETKLKEAESSLRKSEQSLAGFQREHNLIALDQQLRTAVESLATLSASVTAAEVELQVAKQTYGGSHPEIIRLKSHIAELRDQLRKARLKPSDADSFQPGLNQMAALGQTLSALIRDVRTNEAIYGLLLQQYEEARLAEAQEGPLLQILDTAVVPDRAVSPKPTFLIVVSVFLGLLLGTLSVLGRHWFRTAIYPLWVQANHQPHTN